MATTPTVLGNVPLEYTDPNKLTQVSIPLSALKFTNGQLSVDSSKWPTPASSATLPGFVTAMLTSMAQQGLITPVPTPAPKPAMAVTAADAGSAGNGITVTFTITGPNLDPTKTVFSVTVAETDTYTGLTLATISQVIGTKAKAGATPGLVHLTGTLAASGLPAKVTTPQPLGGAGASATITLNDTATPPNPYMTLEAKKPGADGALTKVSIPNVDNVKNTFDLTATWSKTVSGVTLPTLQSNFSNLGYELGSPAAPPSGIISVPSGAVQLTGGTDGTSATTASAIVFAGQ